MSHRAEIRPATALPIITELAGLKRDLLPEVRYRLSCENGEYNAALIGGGARYSEVSARTRENFREFWYGLIRRMRDGHVRAWEGEVSGWRRRRAEAGSRKRAERKRAYWDVTGVGRRADPKL